VAERLAASQEGAEFHECVSEGPQTLRGHFNEVVSRNFLCEVDQNERDGDVLTYQLLKIRKVWRTVMRANFVVHLRCKV
jgi:hypothetical protein